MRAAVLACLLVGCYSPKIPDGKFTCTKDSECASGFVCRTACGNTCYRSASSACSENDMGVNTGDGGVDMAGGDMAGGKHDDGCSNGGHRAAMDPNLPTLAFCDAAWLAPGLTQTTTCGRAPTASGKSASSANCSAADNCAMGWHICNDETELAQKGLTASMCSAIATTATLYVSLQGGSVPMNDMGMPSGAPQCPNPMPRQLFGCGTAGQNPTSCSISNRVLFDVPGGSDDCMLAMNWLCTGVTMAMTDGEQQKVTKTGIPGGGVICCHD